MDPQSPSVAPNDLVQDQIKDNGIEIADIDPDVVMKSKVSWGANSSANAWLSLAGERRRCGDLRIRNRLHVNSGISGARWKAKTMVLTIGGRHGALVEIGVCADGGKKLVTSRTRTPKQGDGESNLLHPYRYVGELATDLRLQCG